LTPPDNLIRRIARIRLNWKHYTRQWMRCRMGINHQALKLLQNESFLELERAIAKTSGNRMSTSYTAPWLIAPYIGDQLRAAGLRADDVPGLVATNQDLIVEFLMACDQALDETPDEYDAEEEAWEPEAKPEGEGPLGFGAGFSITYLIYIIYLRDRSEEGLTEYLKATRVPGAAAYTAELNRLYKWVLENRASD